MQLEKNYSSTAMAGETNQFSSLADRHLSKAGDISGDFQGASLAGSQRVFDRRSCGRLDGAGAKEPQ
jgi:hypothetical protein